MGEPTKLISMFILMAYSVACSLPRRFQTMYFLMTMVETSLFTNWEIIFDVILKVLVVASLCERPSTQKFINKYVLTSTR